MGHQYTVAIEDANWSRPFTPVMSPLPHSAHYAVLKLLSSHFLPNQEEHLGTWTISWALVHNDVSNNHTHMVLLSRE
jgi:hypothetical protein